MLIYITSSLFEKTKLHVVLKIVLASAIMLGYDLIVEPIAPAIHMWEFDNNRVPIRNYLAWFLIALFFHTLIKIFSINVKNRLAGVIFICQIAFFLTLLFTYKIIN
jgi:putative membrane protein